MSEGTVISFRRIGSAVTCGDANEPERRRIPEENRAVQSESESKPESVVSSTFEESESESMSKSLRAPESESLNHQKSVSEWESELQNLEKLKSESLQ